MLHATLITSLRQPNNLQPLPFLLHVKKRDPVRGTQQKRPDAGVEYFVRACDLDLLHDVVLHVFDDDGVRPVQHGKAVTRHPHCRYGGRALALGSWGKNISLNIRSRRLV